MHIIKEDYSGCCGNFEILLCNLFSGNWTPAHLWVDLLLGLRKRNPIVLARMAGSGTWAQQTGRKSRGEKEALVHYVTKPTPSPCTPPPGLLGVNTSLLTGKTVWWAFLQLAKLSNWYESPLFIYHSDNGPKHFAVLPVGQGPGKGPCFLGGWLVQVLQRESGI